MTTDRPYSHRVLLLSSDRPLSPGGQSPLIRRYRLARLRPEGRASAGGSRVEQIRRLQQ